MPDKLLPGNVWYKRLLLELDKQAPPLPKSRQPVEAYNQGIRVVLEAAKRAAGLN